MDSSVDFIKRLLNILDKEFENANQIIDLDDEDESKKFLDKIFDNSSGQLALKLIYLVTNDLRYENLDEYCKIYNKHKSLSIIERYMVRKLVELVNDGQEAMKLLRKLIDIE